MIFYCILGPMSCHKDFYCRCQNIYAVSQKWQLMLKTYKERWPDKCGGCLKCALSIEKAEQAIIEAVEEKGMKTNIEYGEAAFYGPKLDFLVKDALGRSWQLGTIQVDYNLPDRFELEYIGSDEFLEEEPDNVDELPEDDI